VEKPKKINLTKEQSERFAKDWLETKLVEIDELAKAINDIVTEIKSKLA